MKRERSIPQIISRTHFVVFSRSVVSNSFATTVARQTPLFMGFPRQEYWSGLPFPSPGDLPDPGIEPVSPVLAGGFFTTESPEKPSPKLAHCHSTVKRANTAAFKTVPSRAKQRPKEETQCSLGLRTLSS